MNEELNQDDLETGKRLQSPKVGVLSSCLVKIARTRLHASREVLDGSDDLGVLRAMSSEDRLRC